MQKIHCCCVRHTTGQGGVTWNLACLAELSLSLFPTGSESCQLPIEKLFQSGFHGNKEKLAPQD